MSNGNEKRDAQSVIAGTIERIADYAFNPSREKIREMTIVDRLQARLFPIMDIINLGREYCIQVATFLEMGEREYAKYAKASNLPHIPEIPNLCEEWIYRTAQWQKSVGGRNLEKATDIALAEIESKLDDELGEGGGADIYKD